MKIVCHKVSIKADFYGLIEYIFILFVILSFRTPFALAIQRNYYLNEITAILSVILFISEISKVKLKFKLFNNWLCIFIPYYIAMILFVILGGIGNGITAFIAKFLIVLPVLSLTFTMYFYEHRIIDLLKKYCNIICVIAVISLFFWLFGSVLHIIHPTGYFYALWGTPYNYPSYHNLYFERQYVTIFGIETKRNMGMFLEAPMYSSCLVIAIAIELFLTDDLKYYEDVNKKLGYSFSLKQLLRPKTLILIITLLTTFTSTGAIMLIFMIFLFILINDPKNRLIKILKYIFIVFIAVAAFYFAYMIFLDKSTSSSWMFRTDDYYAGFRSWLDSPIWGNGFGNLSAAYVYMGSFRNGNYGFSNGIFVVLVEGGVIFMSIYLLPLILCIYNTIRQKKYGMTVFTSIILIEFIVAVIHYEFLMMLLLALFYSFTIYSMGKKSLVRK